MTAVTTEAWVLYSAARQPGHGKLLKEPYTFPGIAPREVLARPLFGCLEGNMLHALQRDPVDICAERREEPVVLGNAGVVQIEEVGAEVETLRAGDTCLVFCNGVWDAHGYPIKILAYDAPGTMGVLAKKMKLHEKQLIKLPAATPFSLPQWAAFSLRYICAWANWRVAYDCWRSQMTGVAPQDVVVCAWGGGVSYAQLTLARHAGCRTIMVCSQDRVPMLQQAGIDPIDRSSFADADFEKGFLEAIAEKTDGRGVSIFIDNIGTPVFALTLKALARQGVIATCGWKCGMRTPVARAVECLQRRIHVHTHYARYAEGLDAVQFAHEHHWIPPDDGEVWRWEDIPDLIEAYANGKVTSYFPVFSVNT